MTRKQRSQAGRNNITYDLSNPRNVAAFEALLADDEEEEAVDAHQRRQHNNANANSRQPGQKKKREKEKFFQLRSDAPPADDDDNTSTTAPAAASQSEQIQQLVDMFGADRSLVSDVYHAAGCSLEAAAEALFGLLGGAGGDLAAAGAGGEQWPSAQGGCRRVRSCQGLSFLLVALATSMCIAQSRHALGLTLEWALHTVSPVHKPGTTRPVAPRTPQPSGTIRC